jgi:hypothetical protein
MTSRRSAVCSVGARHAVPLFSILPTPTVNLTPLSATLTKKPGDRQSARSATASFVGAQFIAPSSPMFSTLPRSTNASDLRGQPTPTASLTPLNATLTKTRGVLFES